jgi:8-oxo-dGTP pyrophosphatase MutT (NUDIX family)
MDKTALRNAATVIVIRKDNDQTRVLMGQRGAQAAFMPNKFVFPGGAVDAQDADIVLASPIPDPCKTRLTEDSDDTLGHPLCVAAIRELWEETGLILGTKGDWLGHIPDDWRDFANRGYVPDASALRFVFRAITPPGRPRRFDARFFVIDADAVSGDLDDFGNASDELSHLSWIPIDQVRNYNLPFITEVVLAEVMRQNDPSTAPASVPFFKNNEEENLFLHIHGHAPTD